MYLKPWGGCLELSANQIINNCVQQEAELLKGGTVIVLHNETQKRCIQTARLQQWVGVCYKFSATHPQDQETERNKDK